MSGWSDEAEDMGYVVTPDEIAAWERIDRLIDQDRPDPYDRASGDPQDTSHG